MQLYYRKIGKGRPFIILHGLYGSSDNWVSFARNMEGEFEFFIPDLRNHGQTAHSNAFDLNVMRQDIFEWINTLNIENPVIMGHSMGGKIAMELVNQHPFLFSSLIVLDISPLPYNINQRQDLLNHQHILQSLQTVNLSSYTSRQQIEDKLLSLIHDKILASFLMKNLKRNKDNTFEWRLNIAAIQANLQYILSGIKESVICNLPSLFIKAQNSGYIQQNDIEAIKTHYPNAEIIEIPKANHWLHADQPTLLANKIRTFLNK